MGKDRDIKNAMSARIQELKTKLRAYEMQHQGVGEPEDLVMRAQTAEGEVERLQFALTAICFIDPHSVQGKLANEALARRRTTVSEAGGDHPSEGLRDGHCPHGDGTDPDEPSDRGFVCAICNPPDGAT